MEFKECAKTTSFCSVFHIYACVFIHMYEQCMYIFICLLEGMKYSKGDSAVMPNIFVNLSEQCGAI